MSSDSASGVVPAVAASRPTEAQLKWARLHHKRVASAVKISVCRLWLYPPSSADEDGADSSRDSETSDVDAVHRRIVPNRPVISRGRRSLLRVSQRSYEERRRFIALHGFHHPQCEEEYHSSSDEEEALHAVSFNQSSLLAGNISLNGITTSVRRKKRRRRWKPRCSDPDRVRRFKEAFHAAMHSLSNKAEPRAASLSPRTKWVRPADGRRSSVIHTIYDENYSVWGSSSVPKRKAAVHNPVLTPGKAPLDRRASWRVYTAKKSDTTIPSRYSQSMSPEVRALVADGLVSFDGSNKKITFTPEMRGRVADVARSIFSGEGGQRSHGLSHEFLESDVASFVDHFELHMAEAAQESTLLHDELAQNDATDDRGIVQAVTYDSEDLDESSIDVDDEYGASTSLLLDSSFAFCAPSSTWVIDDPSSNTARLSTERTVQSNSEDDVAVMASSIRSAVVDYVGGSLHLSSVKNVAIDPLHQSTASLLFCSTLLAGTEVEDATAAAAPAPLCSEDQLRGRTPLPNGIDCPQSSVPVPSTGLDGDASARCANDTWRSVAVIDRAINDFPPQQSRPSSKRGDAHPVRSGCGLTSQRMNYSQLEFVDFDIRWEKRLMM